MGKEQYSPTPYDDVFRTLVNDCSKLVIPLINEAFGEHYSGDEEIRFSPNEHFLNQQDGQESKRITDSSFAIMGKTTKRYHLECQATPDYSILIRIFEYDAQIALDQDSEVVDNSIVVSFPHTAVLFLRSNSSTPDIMKIVIRTPGGDVSYAVPVIKTKRYTIDDIFSKKLYFLIPFYIFTYEVRFSDIENDSDKLDGLLAEYRQIAQKLESLVEHGTINEFYKRTIMEMTERVLINIAHKYANIQKGVGNIMGGQVLDYEAKRIYKEGHDEGYDKGHDEGYDEGHDEGYDEGYIEALISLVKDGILSFQDAARRAGLSETEFREKITAH